ncbi:MAG: D-alanyl-D-alanine carboxypeptidase, partial [Gemmatimonadales bacterium]
MGLILILVVAVSLRRLPPSGSGGLAYLILPALTLGIRSVVFLSRMTGAAMQEVLQSDFIRTARAKGLLEARVVLSHAVRDALLPLLTVLDFGSHLTGSILTETIFSWPGVGRYVLAAIDKRDLPAVQGSILFLSLVFVIVSLLTNLLHAKVDPRVSHGSFACPSLRSGLRLRMTTVLLALLTAIPSAPAFAQKLSKRIDARLDAPPFNRQLWGVALVDPSGKLLYGRNERQLFTPASNLKLVVSAVAAALLPPDWTARTSLYGAGPVVNGALLGDLVLYGRGDPTFSRRCYGTDSTRAGVCDTDQFARLRQLADALKAKGVREVHGDLVGDGSYFEPTTVHPGWESFDLNWWYAAPVSGLGFNDNSVDFAWQPGLSVGAPALISMTPDLGYVYFENRTVTVAPGGVT